MSIIRCIAFFILSNTSLAAINVSSLATAGMGTALSPWTGWDTAITWAGEQQYNFPGGVYAYADSPNFLKTGIALVGEAGTVLNHTGSGNAVVFDNNGSVVPKWTFNVRMENFIIQGNAATTNGLFLRGVRNGLFKHISVRDVSNAGIWTEACVTNILENFRVSHHEMPNDAFNVVPTYGIVFAARGGDTSTTWTVLNPVIEGVTGIGIWVQNGCYANTIINGTSEGNPGKGMVLDSQLNTVINTDFEANSGNNLEINRPRNVLINLFSLTRPAIIGSNSHMNQFISGEYTSITTAGMNHVLQGVNYGSLTDNAANTYRIGTALGPNALWDSRVGNNVPSMMGITVVGGIANTPANMSSVFNILANQNIFLANPTNPTNGQKITWRIQQTGGSQISYGSKFRPPAGNSLPQLALPSGTGIYYISAMYNSVFDTWDVQ